MVKATRHGLAPMTEFSRARSERARRAHSSLGTRRAKRGEPKSLRSRDGSVYRQSPSVAGSVSRLDLAERTPQPGACIGSTRNRPQYGEQRFDNFRSMGGGFSHPAGGVAHSGGGGNR